MIWHRYTLPEFLLRGTFLDWPDRCYPMAREPRTFCNLLQVATNSRKGYDIESSLQKAPRSKRAQSDQSRCSFRPCVLPLTFLSMTTLDRGGMAFVRPEI